MCKDTAISKKKLEEGIDFEKVASYFGMSYSEFYSKSTKVRKEMVERYKKDNTSLKGATDHDLPSPLKEDVDEDNRKHALLRVEPRNYEAMIDKLQDMNINHRRESDTVIKLYTDGVPDKVLYNLTHDVYVDKFVLKEEMTSTVSKARAKSELKQMLKGKRDDGMGKSTLKAVLAIDKDGKETKVKKLEDFDKFEKGTKFSLKETTMNNDRLTELIKTALKGQVKEESTPIKEGTWSSGTYTEIGRFLQDIKNLKDKYYDIVGSDDVYDGLDRAEESAREMMINAPENRSDIDEDLIRENESEQWKQFDVDNVNRSLRLTFKTFNNFVVNLERLEKELSKHTNKPQGTMLQNMVPDSFDYMGTKDKLHKLYKGFNAVFSMNESFDSLTKKLDKQKGITKDEAGKIAGSIAAKKRAGAGKGPTAKQKKRMSETILKKLRG